MQPGPEHLIFMQCNGRTGGQVQVHWNGIVQFFTLNTGS